MWCRVLQCFVWLALANSLTFSHPPSSPILLRSESEGSHSETESDRKPCVYKQRRDNRGPWIPRVHIHDVEIGQRLEGYVVQEYLNGKTGPKVFLECGIGRTNSTGDWKMVFPMLRLPREKKSTAAKRAARLKKRSLIEVFVSRVFRESGQVEVSLTEEESKTFAGKKKKSVTKLKPLDEVVGEVVRIEPYGVFVEFGANRNGLLHIQKVADLYEKYIDKEEGLISSGLEKGAKVRLVIESIQNRRISLDFTEDVKRVAREEAARESERLGRKVDSQEDNSVNLSEEELRAWEEYASGQQQVGAPVSSEETTVDDDDDVEYDDYDDDDDDDYDRYDEERDIEDALGLGSY